MSTPPKNHTQKSDDEFSEKALLTHTFSPEALIYTYTGGQRLAVKTVLRFAILGRNRKKHKQQIKKIDTLFAIKSDTLENVKKGVTLDKTVKAQNLRTPEKRADRPTVLTKENLELGQNRAVRIVMRSGHVLRGDLLQVSRYNLVLNINAARVLVYQHGVLEYSVTPQHSEK